MGKYLDGTNEEKNSYSYKKHSIITQVSVQKLGNVIKRVNTATSKVL